MFFFLQFFSSSLLYPELGLFNADPHGGNFLLLEDGRIGLIDYGSTKRLSENERINACVLYAALKRNDKHLLWTMAKVRKV